MRAWNGLPSLVVAVAALLGACSSDGTIDTSGVTSGTGASGTGTSVGGAGGGCAEEEKCNSIDDDCDGVVDEDCACIEGDSQPCYSGDPLTEGVGVCIGGEQLCDDSGAWGACEGEVTPDSAETCNGDDDDCNGEADEGFGSVTCGLGICQMTVDECVDGVPQACVPGDPARAETCDGSDDDCDGDVDEGCSCIDGNQQPCYTGSPSTQNIGECKDGSQTCAGGQWGSCNGDVTPTTEVCDALDNDCDGLVDENNPGGGGGCNTGQQGVCSVGSFQCVSGNVDCVQLNQPSNEVCNGLDDDCDGAVDNGNPGGGGMCTTGLPGICSQGTLACQSGALMCAPNNQPQTEQCNGLDDNCDNVVDDGNPGGNTACSTGQQGVCAAGTTQCQGGTVVCNQNVQSSNEQCNGLDDNCNGSVDEGNPGGGASCNTGQAGPCGPGTFVCQSGSLACVGNVGPTTETCNSVDDDCNGIVDNGNNFCGGACPLSAQPLSACDGPDGDLCLEGFWQCQGLNNVSCSDNSPTNVEICDSIDQDCDGNISEGPCSLPNASSTCSNGSCVISSCNNGFTHCDTSQTNGCELQHSGHSNNAPGQSMGTHDCDASSGFICGGHGCDFLTSFTGTRGRYFTINAHEGSSCCAYVSVKFELVVPVGIDYDLYVTGNGCSASPGFSSTGAGNNTIVVWCNDDCGGGDNSFTANVEVRYDGGHSCQPWTLNVYRRGC